MKHLKPLTKAQSTDDVSGIISLVLSLLSALAPIITWLINSKQPPA
jgi:hypothetical protein